MTDFTSPIVGTITMEPRLSIDVGRHAAPLADDSTLDALLTSLAQCPSLADADQRPRLVACTRLCRFFGSEAVAGEDIRADLARLVEDLESEYERLAAV
jgi:hypothetical protein